MSRIKTFYSYSENNFEKIKNYKFGNDWPVVYILENEKEMYIGETIGMFNRIKQHYEKEERRILKKMHLITDEEYNKSAALDIESSLIQYISADGKYKLQNGNSGLKNHDYYNRPLYQAKFEDIWEELKKVGIVEKDLLQIRNSDLFKYSPYKSLTSDQINVVMEIKKHLKEKDNGTFIVEGKPGTGKTIVATYLVKNLLEQDEFKNMKIGLVIPMGSLRKTLKKVFGSIKGLKSNMVIGPAEVIKNKYDLLIVDEAHRLRKRKNLGTYFGAFDKVNKLLNLKPENNELDWMLKSSKYQILFYDENQSIKPSDVSPQDFQNIKSLKIKLNNQKRVLGGEEYIRFVNDILDLQQTKPDFRNYDFKVFDNLSEMVDLIKQKNNEKDLCRIVAGYAWPWVSRNGADYDIDIDGIKMVWNRTAHDWVNSENAVNEVGCIHTVQGYDLNYTGVIFGPEISYDKENNKIIINRDHYYDSNGLMGIQDDSELEGYVVNIYKTLMTRGIHGTYVYVCDKNLREYFKEILK